jgi:hypothetical protein
MRVTLKMPNANGVAPGQTATFLLPIGRTYHNLLLTYAGVTLAQMTEIRLIANGKVMRRVTGAVRQDTFNQFCGLAAANGILQIPLDRLGMRLKDGEEFTSLGTGIAGDPQQVTTLNLEIDISAAAAAPVLSLKAIQSEPRPFGMISKIREFSHNPAAAGDYEISDLPRADLIGRIYLNKAGINSVRVERDGFVLFERTAAENSLIQNDGMRVSQANYFIIDPSENGFAGETIPAPGAQDLRLIINVAAAGAMPVIVEYIGLLST